MVGDFTAMSAYADYLEEYNYDQALVVGLRFCIRHKKFPRNWKGSGFPFEWYFSKGKSKWYLPAYFKNITPYWFASAQAAIKSVGRSIIKINQDFKEVI